MSAEEGVVASHQLEITVDHNQFFVEDCEREIEVEDLAEDLVVFYGEDARSRHLGVAPGALCIFTARWYGIVHLDILLTSAEPQDDLTQWDNVAEASIELPSGCIVVYAPESYPSGPRLSLPIGTYRVRVYSAGIDTVDEYMQDGQDHYRMVFWPAPMAPPALVHAGVTHPW